MERSPARCLAIPPKYAQRLRQVLVPVFLEPCTLPVPFNAVDTADLIGWSGDPSDSKWQAVVETVKRTVEKSKADEKQRVAHSLAAHERVTDKIYPGTLRLLIARIVARSDADARSYYDDICVLLEWLESVTQKAARRSA